MYLFTYLYPIMISKVFIVTNIKITLLYEHDASKPGVMTLTSLDFAVVMAVLSDAFERYSCTRI